MISETIHLLDDIRYRHLMIVDSLDGVYRFPDFIHVQDLHRK